MRRRKDVLTTGEVAKICNVAPRTVSKWFDSGKLNGYRIPGSKDRRIPVQQLIRFMKAHEIPLNGLDAGVTRVLVIESDKTLSEMLAGKLNRDAGYEVRVAHSAFEAGAVAEPFKPDVMLVDVAIEGLSGRELVRTIRNLSDLGAVRLIAVCASNSAAEVETMKQLGFDAAVARPFDVAAVVKLIEDLAGGVNE